MEKILISLPEDLVQRMRSTMPARQRSKIITHLIENEVKKREHQLYECARAVEQDVILHTEIKQIDLPVAEGIKDESW